MISKKRKNNCPTNSVDQSKTIIFHVSRVTTALKERQEKKEIKVQLALMEKTEPTDSPDSMERKETKVTRVNKEIKANKDLKVNHFFNVLFQFSQLIV